MPMSDSVPGNPWEVNGSAPNCHRRREIAAKMLRKLAEPRPGGESVKTAITRVSKLANLDFWRTSDLWYSKTRRVEDRELKSINEALIKKDELETRNELQNLRLRIARLESRLVSTDAEFHREDIAALEFTLRRPR